MRERDVKRYKQTLLWLRERVEGSYESLRQTIAEETGGPNELSHLPTHEADHGAADLEMGLILSQSENQILRQIEGALERIRDGAFGRCVECEEDIAKERLDAIPYTAYCIACKRKIEAE